MGLSYGETSGTYQTAIREVGAMSSWGPGRIILRNGSPTTVKFRVTDGVKEYWYTAGAWTEATDAILHWNDPDDLYDALPSWTDTSLGFIFKLTRTLATDDTPEVCGVKAVCRLLLAQTTTDETIASSWMDDLIHRVFIRQMKVQLVLPGAHEFTATADNQTVINYADGVDEYPYDVRGVEAVYDMDGSGFASALTGTWVGGSTKTWTPDTPFTVGHVIHSRFQFRPEIAHTANQDHFVSKLPSILVESVASVPRRKSYGHLMVEDPGGVDAVVVDEPEHKIVSLGCRIVTVRATDRDRIVNRIEDWLGAGVTLLSPSSSMPIELNLVGGIDDGKVIGDQFDAVFDVEADILAWPGNEVSGHRLVEHGLDFEGQGSWI